MHDVFEHTSVLKSLHLDVLIPAIAAVVLQADISLRGMRIEGMVRFVRCAAGTLVGSGEKCLQE